MDATFVWRDKNAASGIGSNFGSVPYNNVVNGKLSETRFSPQNSRIGFRVDGNWKGAHFIGYNEFDFLGTSGALNLNTTNGAFVPRLRLYWVDARKGGWEFLAGQSWSMLTPNRVGISPLPGDLFYSQVMDVNYMAGLTWTRQPGFRVLYHAGDKITFGFSAEEPDQYIGGSSGGSTVVLPAAFTALSGTQLDNASYSNPYAGPQLVPDFIGKIALDPSSHFHAEVAGIVSTFKIIDTLNLIRGPNQHQGGRRYSSGTERRNLPGLPADHHQLLGRWRGTLSVWTSSGCTVERQCHFEPAACRRHRGWFRSQDGQAPAVRLLRRDLHRSGRDSRHHRQDPALVGYGYTGSANSQNREIQEITFGFNQTMWANPRYGAINMIGQYEWLSA